MKFEDFMKMSRECDWAADAVVKTFDPETEQYQPVTGATYDDREIKLYTDCDECGEDDPCAAHLSPTGPNPARDAAIGELVEKVETFFLVYEAGDSSETQLENANEDLKSALAAYKKTEVQP